MFVEGGSFDGSGELIIGSELYSLPRPVLALCVFACLLAAQVAPRGSVYFSE